MLKKGQAPDANDDWVRWAIARKGQLLKPSERIPDEIWMTETRKDYCEALVVFNKTIYWARNPQNWLKAVVILKMPWARKTPMKQLQLAA